MSDHGDADGEATGPSTAEALAAAGVPGRPTAVKPLGRGNSKRTRLVRQADRGPVVVVQTGSERALRTEARLLAALAERTAVPVPELLGAGVRGGRGVLVTGHVAGADLHERFVGLSGDRRRAVARTFGRTFGAVHGAFGFDSAGPLRVAEDALAPGPNAGPGWLDGYARWAIEGLPAAVADLRDPLLGLVKERGVGGGGARLFPWGLRPGNAVVADGAVRAVLDWERPLAGPPGLAAAKVEYLVADWYVPGSAVEPGRLRAAFRAGYREQRPWPEPTATQRAVAVAASAVDAAGAVTRPGWPEREGPTAVAFHRKALERAVDAA